VIAGPGQQNLRRGGRHVFLADSTPNGATTFHIWRFRNPNNHSGRASQWLTNTLCVLRGASIYKTAYWSMYDPYIMWTAPPWYKTGQDLAWNGFWGLVYEDEYYGGQTGMVGAAVVLSE
jgi:hypothetical protein